MLKAKKLVAFFSCIFLCAIWFYAEPGAFAERDSEGWTSLGDDVYINKKSLAYPSADTVSLWVKVVPGNESDLLYAVRNNLIEKGKLYQANFYEYSGYLSEIDCAKKRHREFLTILYDTNKNIIQSEENRKAAWDDISPDSSFLVVYEAVCGEQPPSGSNERFFTSAGC